MLHIYIIVYALLFMTLLSYLVVELFLIQENISSLCSMA